MKSWRRRCDNMADHKHHPITYRPDIDGLRAIAILAIMGFHAFPKTVEGGFIGVDIFFVISGFLITSIIMKDMARGTFSFREFYARRIRRIFPALILVILVTLAFGWLVLFPEEMRQLYKHAALASIFVPNIGFWLEAGYFDNSAETKPFLHFWSLGVEEQFYILWPLLLVVGAVRFRALLPLFFFASFALNAVLIFTHPEATFFLPFTRCWELAAGGLLAAAMHNGYAARLPFSPNIRAWAGFVLIALAVIFFEDNFLFPGFWALMPVAGSALIISAGMDARINRVVLANRAAVGIGLISYPLYLWHWPILSFLHILKISTPLTIIGGVALTFLLAWLTYIFLENKVRNVAAMRCALPLLFAALCCLALGVAGWRGAVKPHLDLPQLYKYFTANEDWAFPPPVPRQDLNKIPLYKLQGDMTDEVLYLGDSNLQQFGPRIEAVMNDPEKKTYSASFLTMGGCRPIPGVMKGSRDKCLKLMPSALEYIDANPVRRVVIGGRWSGALTSSNIFYRGTDGNLTALNDDAARSAALAGLEDFIRGLQGRGIEVYLVQNIPHGLPEMSGPAVDRVALVMGQVNEDSYKLPERHARAGTIDEGARALIAGAAQRTGAIVLDPLDNLCDAKTCVLTTPELPRVYKDAAHLRAGFVREYSDFIDRTIMAD